MPVRVEWYNTQQTILLERFEGHWGYEDFCHMVDLATEFLKAKDYTVHIITDFSHAELTSRDTLSAVRYAESKLAPNQGVVVFVQPSMLVDIAVDLARQAGFRAAEHLYTANTLKGAVSIIEQHKGNI